MIDITMLDNKEKSHKELAAEWIECCIDHGVSLRSALEFVGYPAEAKGWGFVERMAALRIERGRPLPRPWDRTWRTWTCVNCGSSFGDNQPGRCPRCRARGVT